MLFVIIFLLASLDAGSSQDFVAHRILLGAGIYGIENLNGEVENIPLTGATLQVMPMKITGGSGAPARVFAALPRRLKTSKAAVQSESAASASAAAQG